MPKIIDNLTIETEYVLETIQRKEKPIILKNMIEKKISSNLEKYPNHGYLKDFPPMITNPIDINRILGTEVYRKQSDSWIISHFGSGEAVYG